MKIKATLDLTQSLSHFQGTITSLLNLGNLEEFDGAKLRKIEQKIINEALILAGQCIALLLSNLSDLPEAHVIAQRQTQGWWRKKTVKNGKVPRSILTIGNVVVELFLPYVVERDEAEIIKKRKRKSRHQGFCPFLRWLGMEERVTPLVWSTIALYATINHSFETARKILKDWGIDINLRRIERLTYVFGRGGVNQRDIQVNQCQRGEIKPSNLLKDKRVVISADGGRTKIRLTEEGKLNPNTNRKSYKTDWIEPKLLTIYTVDEQGKKIKTGEVPIVNDGTFGDSSSFLKLLEMHLVTLGINQAKQVLLVADAAQWIWLRIPPLLEKLGCPVETYYLWDFYHVTEHLSSFAFSAFKSDQERRIWFNTARSNLRWGQVESLIEDMKTIRKNSRGTKRINLTKEINYVERGWKQGRLNYPKISALNLPLGSGAVESLIRQVVNLRLKGNSKLWLKRHAEIILHARCQWVAGSWEQFCQTVLNSRIFPVS